LLVISQDDDQALCEHLKAGVDPNTIALRCGWRRANDPTSNYKWIIAISLLGHCLLDGEIREKCFRLLISKGAKPACDYRDVCVGAVNALRNYENLGSAIELLAQSNDQAKAAELISLLSSVCGPEFVPNINHSYGYDEEESEEWDPSQAQGAP
jgi:hypothetical protein